VNSDHRKKKVNGKRIALIVLCVLLALLLVLLIFGTAYMERMLSLINRNQGNETMSSSEYADFLNSQTEDTIPEDFTGEVIDPSDVTWDAQDAITQGENIVNILLIGQDRRAGEGRSRSDAMILCTINKSAGTLTLTSFMRDMYVQIPGYYDDRINTCYFLGGMDLLNKCLEVNFGVQIDGNVEVDFDGFMTVIDILGGIDIELSKAEADYLNRRGNWEVYNETNWTLQEGMNHLNGSQALAYSRIRYVGNDDFQRTERQRNVINALIEKSKSMSLAQMNNLLTEILPLITTDMTNAEIVNYALQLFPLLPKLSITNQRIPADGAYRSAWVGEKLVMLPDLETNRKLLESCIAAE